MNTFVPLPIYSDVFYVISVLIAMLLALVTFVNRLDAQGYVRIGNFLAVLLLIFTALYLGMRPISYVFGDMGLYNETFLKYKMSPHKAIESDVLFYGFMKWSAQLMSPEWFFFVCAQLYIIPLYLVSKKWFYEYWFIAFVALIVSFSFWAYGTNGIRNGLATSWFLFALSRTNKYWMLAFAFLTVLIHKSMLLPFVPLLVTVFFKPVKPFFLFWVASIPVSLVMGGFFTNLFLGFGFGEDDKLQNYLSGSQEGLDGLVEVKTGFRWDFILYSATGVLSAFYFIIKKGYQDVTYDRIVKIYLFVNAIWILVIRANFSNRFAYLSWFLLAILLFYPISKSWVTSQQNKMIALMLFAYAFFTLFMNLML